MTYDQNQPTNNNDLANFIKANAPPDRQNRDFSLIDTQTNIYLQSDKQNLQTAREEAQQTGETERAKYLKRRLDYYYHIEDLFFFLLENNQSTRLTNITSAIIETFLNRQRPISRYKPTKQSLIQSPSFNRMRASEKTELKYFFNRAEEQGVIPHNPFIPLIKMKPELAPVHPSKRTLADSKDFETYLQRLVDNNRLSPATADLYWGTFCTLLHDVEQYHSLNNEWPVELDELFANSKWVFEWLNNLENRSVGATSITLDCTLKTA